uniref:uncharacterized protein LOC112431498 n=1 Tax=Maylandia zebra TaxID=106582 RepID=UPI000D30D951
MALLRDPPAQGKYAALKELLLRRYALSDTERAEKLLNLSGWVAPHFRRSRPGYGHAGGTFHASTCLPRSIRPLADGRDCYTPAPRKEHLFLPSAFWRQSASLPAALRFHGPGKRTRQRAVAAATAGNTERLLFIEDSRSGRRFLVDSGSQKSLLPPTAADGLAANCGPQLIAANGSPIKTFGERLVTVCFHGRDFQWNFVVAASSVPILGADFLCAHGLLVDVANRRLIDALSFSSLPCFTRAAEPLIRANVVTSGDAFQRLLLEFPSLSVPNFSSTVTKHGVEHYIPTVGPPVFALARRLDPAK